MTPGEIVGRYELVEPLARGGMAEVWLARSRGEQGFTRNLVIKSIHPHLADDAHFERMFIDEALLAARLNHPNVVQILDLGKHADRYFIVMEYVHGVTLRQVARAFASRKRVVPPWFLLRMTAAACEGLHHAHELTGEDGAPLNIVHRDVSPENLMISRSGVVKVLDFGVAKATTAATQTRAGTFKGKLSYLPPELVQGETPDRRCDIYAVGVLLYECLTGRRPYVGNNELELVQRITEARPPPLARLAPWMPEPIQHVIQKAMHVDREQRFPTARALADELTRILSDVLKDTRTERDLGAFVNAVFPESAPAPARPETGKGGEHAAEVAPVAPSAKRDVPAPGPQAPSTPDARPASTPTRPPAPQPEHPTPARPAAAPAPTSPGAVAAVSPRSRPLTAAASVPAPAERAHRGFGALLSSGAPTAGLPDEGPVPGAPSHRGERQPPSWLTGSRTLRSHAAETPEDDGVPGWLRRKREASLASALGASSPPARPVRPAVELPAEEGPESGAVVDVDASRVAQAEQHAEWGQVFEREGRLDLAQEEYERAERLAPAQTRARQHLARLAAGGQSAT